MIGLYLTLYLYTILQSYTKARNADIKAFRAVHEVSRTLEVKENVEQENKGEVHKSPTKEELKALLKIEVAKNTLFKKEESKKESSSSSATSEKQKLQKDSEKTKETKLHLCPINEDQLFGKDWADDTMILLLNDIYCKRIIHDNAIGASTKQTHVVRRLLDGVFKREALLKCTCTGKPSAMAAKLPKKPQALDHTAKNAIIEYSVLIAKLKGWDILPKNSLRQAITQRMGEIKREEANAKKQKVDRV